MPADARSIMPRQPSTAHLGKLDQQGQPAVEGDQLGIGDPSDLLPRPGLGLVDRDRGRAE